LHELQASRGADLGLNEEIHVAAVHLHQLRARDFGYRALITLQHDAIFFAAQDQRGQGILAQLIESAPHACACQRIFWRGDQALRLGCHVVGNFYAAEEDALDAEAEAVSGNKPNKGKLVEFALQVTASGYLTMLGA
jgi:hypothetical protein